jgi:hypothetical protein
LLQDCTTGTSVAVVGKSTLYDAYVRYCDDEMLPAIPKGQFGAALKSMNSHDTRRRGERRWKGLRVREGNEVPDLGFSRFGLDAAVERDAPLPSSLRSLRDTGDADLQLSHESKHRKVCTWRHPCDAPLKKAQGSAIGSVGIRNHETHKQT